MNSDILQAFFTELSDAALGYPIAWPNVPFERPNTGQWLEVTHFPNKGLDVTLAGQSVIRQGLFQVAVVNTQNGGIFDLEVAAAEVAAVFPKLTPLANVRVSAVPYSSSAISVDDGRVALPVTIAYSG